SEPPTEGRTEPTYTLPSPLLSSYTEKHESEPLLSSSVLSGSMARYTPEPVAYSAPSPILSGAAAEAEPPAYSLPSGALSGAPARETVIDASPAPAFSSYAPKVQSYTTEVIVVRTFDTTPAPMVD